MVYCNRKTMLGGQNESKYEMGIKIIQTEACRQRTMGIVDIPYIIFWFIPSTLHNFPIYSIQLYKTQNYYKVGLYLSAVWGELIPLLSNRDL